MLHFSTKHFLLTRTLQNNTISIQHRNTNLHAKSYRKMRKKIIEDKTDMSHEN